MDYRIREARVEDAESAVRAHERAWDATLAGLAGRPLAELAPLEARVASFRSGIGRAGDDARVWVAEFDLATLWVVEANARARRFYERVGWRPDGTTRATPFGVQELRYRRPRLVE